jgi:hypothetical protein
VLKVLNNPIDAEAPSPSPKPKKFTDAHIAKLPDAPKGKRYAVSDFGDRTGSRSRIFRLLVSTYPRVLMLWRTRSGRSCEVQKKQHPQPARASKGFRTPPAPALAPF